MYKDVAKNIERFNLKLPNTIIPVPTESDYQLGFINRYFIQKANDEDASVFELSEDEYTVYATNPFWKKVELKWRIAGPINPTSAGEVSYDRGVMASNKTALALASIVIKNISLYLPNLLQFHRG